MQASDMRLRKPVSAPIRCMFGHRWIVVAGTHVRHDGLTMWRCRCTRCAAEVIDLELPLRRRLKAHERLEDQITDDLRAEEAAKARAYREATRGE